MRMGKSFKWQPTVESTILSHRLVESQYSSSSIVACTYTSWPHGFVHVPILVLKPIYNEVWTLVQN